MRIINQNQIIIGALNPYLNRDKLENTLGVSLPPKDTMTDITKELKDSTPEYFKDKTSQPDLT